mmetsp:Transcript_90092/g.259717  ORF Transcript_90092/g.259717 Transcript_90092/m.259717 type:complete len:280 (+) Transcript_90092:434-1273(+)
MRLAQRRRHRCQRGFVAHDLDCAAAGDVPIVALQAQGLVEPGVSDPSADRLVRHVAAQRLTIRQGLAQPSVATALQRPIRLRAGVAPLAGYNDRCSSGQKHIHPLVQCPRAVAQVQDQVKLGVDRLLADKYTTVTNPGLALWARHRLRRPQVLAELIHARERTADVRDPIASQAPAIRLAEVGVATLAASLRAQEHRRLRAALAFRPPLETPPTTPTGQTPALRLCAGGAGLPANILTDEEGSATRWPHLGEPQGLAHASLQVLHGHLVAMASRSTDAA